MINKMKEIRRFLSSANSQSLKNSRKVIGKKQGTVFNERDSMYRALITPERVVNRIDVLQIGDESHAFMGAAGYPGSLAHNWLSTIVDGVDETNINFSQFISPVDSDKAIVTLQRHINDIETEMVLNEKSGKITPQTTIEKLSSAKSRMQTMTRGTQKAFTISNYFSVHDTDRKKLATSIGTLRSTISGMMIVPKRLYLRSKMGYKCMMPIGRDDLKMERHMDTTAVARSIALPGRARIAGGENGTIMGVEYDTGIPIMYDRFSRSKNNANLLLLAQSGAGKTFWTTLDIMHQVEIGNDVVIFDPKPDYVHVVEELGGVNVSISESSGTGMKPFTLGTGPSDTLTSKIVEIPNFIGLVVGGVTDAAKSALLTCIVEIYNDAGIIAEDRDTWTNEPPSMEDLYWKMVQYIKGELETDIPIQQPDIIAATALLKRLEPACKGPYRSFFSGDTNIDLDAKIINYDISAVPEGIRDAVMYLLLSNTYDYMVARERGFRSVYLEEAWALLSANSEHVRNIVKTCRGFGMSLVVITQDLVDVTGSSAGEAIIGNCATKIVLSMDVAYAGAVGEKVGLTGTESDTLVTGKKGEGYIISGGIATRFKTPSAPMEKELIEWRGIEKRDSEQFDTSGDFYQCKGLSTQQINTLMRLKFTRVTGEKRLGRGTADYMVRNIAANQSIEHFVMVHLIDLAAKELGLHSEIADYGTKFDVTVRNAEGFIIGFEYETGSNHNSAVINKADRLNNRSDHFGAKTWYFVVPSDLVEKYTEIHPNTITGGKVLSLLREFAEIRPELTIETFDQSGEDQ